MCHPDTHHMCHTRFRPSTSAQLGKSYMTSMLVQAGHGDRCRVTWGLGLWPSCRQPPEGWHTRHHPPVLHLQMHSPQRPSAASCNDAKHCVRPGHPLLCTSSQPQLPLAATLHIWQCTMSSSNTCRCNAAQRTLMWRWGCQGWTHPAARCLTGGPHWPRAGPG